ncbi:hypothetical protein RclHR1_04280003 [Rhizophagus clarus]|uniref:Uncharacterized protein n=1 Tax=Rhizophagus clarus TaxID=94130 RepID=A0A2Z6RG24_9GLOM|nr:hypothetical protein RclHR1_04280003 [Rhizophagus clarus]GES85925.1 hypothetical protein GLOIN_2v1548439 [Rhizophagus clarus]
MAQSENNELKEYELKIKNNNNRKETCERALDKVSINGEFSQNSFSINRSKLIDIVNNWQITFHELKDELECWKHSEVGIKYTKKEILCPIPRGKRIQCVFLKIYDKGEEENTLRCVSISGDISIKVKYGFLGFMKRASEYDKYGKMIKSHPEIMAALIMSRSTGLRILWEDENAG